jgi:signal transduction histidine kinase
MRPAPLSALSIRGKLTLATLAPLLAVLLLVSFAASWLIDAWVVGETQKQVRNDLSAAREILRHEQERVGDLVRLTAGSAGLVEAFRRGDLERLATELAAIRTRQGLDVLSLSDARGRLLIRGSAEPATAAGPPGPHSPLALQALREGEFSGVVLLDEEALMREGGALAERALVAGADGGEERRGMFLLGGAPVRAGNGELLGGLYGGVLLNGNLSLVDRIRDIVYGTENHGGVETGSATLFVGDLRVATTVRLSGGERAVGTRVSEEVARAVLREGQPWLARAQVLDRWYLTAYEPIFDPRRQIIGALYVGLLEAPFDRLKNLAHGSLFGLLLLGGGLGYLFSRQIADHLSRPVQRLAESAERVAAGERDIRLPVAGEDEIGHLTAAFNRMTAALRQRDEELGDLTRDLENQVAHRTTELEEKSLELIRAQEELLRSEKLAAIGSLAAGVAHEINNPAAIMRGNVEILLMGITPGAEGREEAEEILRQTERVSLITANLLAFAREQAIHPAPVSIAGLIEEILAQVSHQAPLTGVRIERRLPADLPPVLGDGERLRQVFTNIVLNAVQAMEGQGELVLEGKSETGCVEISVRDSGCGIPPELREKIFNPFFTTKKRGTGLGLSISYGIVKAHDGDISVESAEGQGSIFHIRLPVAG